MPSWATCPSCWSGSRRPEMSPSFASLFSGVLYVRRRGLELDLVILDERDGEAAQRLRTELQTGAAGESLGKPGASSCWPRIGSRPMMRCCWRPPHGCARRWTRVAGRSARPSSRRGAPAAAAIDFTLDRDRGCRGARQGARRTALLERLRRIHAAMAAST